MQNIIDEIDYLKTLIGVEVVLRQSANVEYNNNIHDGPMKKAHDVVLQQIIDAAKSLVAKSG